MVELEFQHGTRFAYVVSPMTVYRYKARDSNGILMTGVMESSGREAAALQLDQLGYLPIRIEETKGWDWRESIKAFETFTTRISAEDLIILTRQMATLITAGLSFVSVFDALVEQTMNPKLKGILIQVRQDVEGGMAFSDALAKHPAVFDHLYVSMIRAGETAGVLDEMLDRLAFLAEHDAETRARINAATRYPKIVLVALAVAFGILVTFVIPRFTILYDNFHATLPFPTRMLIGLNNLVHSHGLVVLIMLIGIIFGARAYLKTPVGHAWWDTMQLRLPIFGPLLLKSALSRFARVFGTLNRCGLPALEALDIVSKTVGNVALSRAIDTIGEGARQGRGLVQPMKASKLFPAGVVQMISIGEETGQLEPMLMKVSEYYDREVDYAIKNLSASLEPMLLVVIGGAVLFLALAIFLPWWNLINVFKGGGG
ncbi:MAG: type II secretion system F family protein [Nitrospirae bacterium]|nr:type II secretion system F family protein [Nitrospirota bacterium]